MDKKLIWAMALLAGYQGHALADPRNVTLLSDLSNKVPTLADTLSSAPPPAPAATIDPLSLDAAGQFKLGERYAAGIGVTQDNAKALYWIEKTAKAGYYPAVTQMGQIYAKGLLGIPVDYAEALQWFNQAANDNYAPAQTAIGTMYQGGAGVQQDNRIALDWYKKAAAQDYGPAESAIGMMYRQGRGVTQDEPSAQKWLLKAAEHGDAFGQIAIGNLYDIGEGVPQDHAMAFSWYSKAAMQDHPAAQNNLADMYQHGRGVPQDDLLAFYWYSRAAEKGYAPALKGLGDLYQTGAGVPQNTDHAIEAYQKAATMGYAPAQEILKQLANPEPPVAKTPTDASIVAPALASTLVLEADKAPAPPAKTMQPEHPATNPITDSTPIVEHEATPDTAHATAPHDPVDQSPSGDVKTEETTPLYAQPLPIAPQPAAKPLPIASKTKASPHLMASPKATKETTAIQPSPHPEWGGLPSEHATDQSGSNFSIAEDTRRR